MFVETYVIYEMGILGCGNYQPYSGPNSLSEQRYIGRINHLYLEYHCIFIVSSNIVRMIKLRRIKWAGHVARMEEGRSVYKVLVGKPEGKNHWGDQDVDGRIILIWIFRKWEGVVRTGWSWLGIGTGGGRL